MGCRVPSQGKAVPVQVAHGLIRRSDLAAGDFIRVILISDFTRI
jgi:hypothetical protein